MNYARFDFFEPVRFSANVNRFVRLGAVPPAVGAWQRKREVYLNAEKYFRMASQSPSGFASSDARVLSRLAEANEGEAQMDAQELASASSEHRYSLIGERDRLRAESDEFMHRARETLVAERVSSTDANYRTVMIARGNLIFEREAGATNEEKAGDYRQALELYQEAAALFSDDPRPFLYQGLCYERLTGIAQSTEEKQRNFQLGEQALRTALTLNVEAPGYSSALPYRALATLYAHVNDYQSVLDSLKNARQADPTGAESAQVDRDIQNVEQYLVQQRKGH